MKVDFNKLTKGVLIFLALLVAFSIFYHYVIFLPQKEEARLEQQRQEQLAKEGREQQALEQKRKEYVAKRKDECYDIEQRERKNYNNVDGSFYDEENDVCKVRYENKKWKKGDPFFSGWNETTQKYEEGKYFTNEF